MIYKNINYEGINTKISEQNPKVPHQGMDAKHIQNLINKFGEKKEYLFINSLIIKGYIPLPLKLQKGERRRGIH